MAEVQARPNGAAHPHAPRPGIPARQYSFTDFQTSNPSGPPPGDRLDREFDGLRRGLTELTAWLDVALNSDGSLKSGSVGRAQLVPGIFEGIAEAARAQIQPLLTEARSRALAAVDLARAVETLAARIEEARREAQAFSAKSGVNALDSAADAASAADSAAQAAASAAAAANSANHSEGDAALSQDWAIVSHEWAEHMPDTIPPNILAMMAITGDHWSSRWWANQAHLIVEAETADAVCQIQQYWLGAYSMPPSLDSCGHPVVPGAAYFDLTVQRTKVWDGGQYVDVVQPVPGNLDEYLYLPAVPTSVFTGVDHNGKTLTFNPATAYLQVGVYLNGVKLLPTTDYTLSTNTVTLAQAVTAPASVEILIVNPTAGQAPQAAGTKINTGIWAFNGTTTTFNLQNSLGQPVIPPSASDCIVSLNGVIQEPAVDFTISASVITFATAPEADAHKWMVVGLPLGAGP